MTGQLVCRFIALRGYTAGAQATFKERGQDESQSYEAQQRGIQP
jgi:hypothetical protein